MDWNLCLFRFERIHVTFLTAKSKRQTKHTKVKAELKSEPQNDAPDRDGIKQSVPSSENDAIVDIQRYISQYSDIKFSEQNDEVDTKEPSFKDIL